MRSSPLDKPGKPGGRSASGKDLRATATISGLPGAGSLVIDFLRSDTKYNVEFQDLGIGRTILSYVTTDGQGAGVVRAPMRWGLNSYKVTAYIIGDPTSVVEFTNPASPPPDADTEYVATQWTEEPPPDEGGAARDSGRGGDVASGDQTKPGGGFHV